MPAILNILQILFYDPKWIFFLFFSLFSFQNFLCIFDVVVGSTSSAPKELKICLVVSTPKRNKIGGQLIPDLFSIWDPPRTVVYSVESAKIYSSLFDSKLL